MAIVKSLFSLRKKSHLFTRFELRDEKTYRRRLLPWLAPVDILFALVDWVSVPNTSLLWFFSLRLAGVIASALFWYGLRGRVRYGLRFFLAVAPYMFVVEYIMIKHSLVLSPYFAGASLVMITAAMLFPVRLLIASLVYTGCMLPLMIWSAFFSNYDHVSILQLLLMSSGTVIVCALNSGHLYSEFQKRLTASELLARDKGRRGRIISEKVQEILKRQIFESQFSPQVVDAVLQDRSIIREMRKRSIVNIVIDIQDSTKKANSLDALHYKQVIEEVLDVFSAACLKWNITLDKFTGDGVQAFAGAPFQTPNDLRRALMACKDTIAMLKARKHMLDQMWKDPLNVRFAICQGEALVGFVGKGIFKSYTAIGDMVSFTHRLSSVPVPWKIATHIWDKKVGADITAPGFHTEYTIVRNLKGFGEQSFYTAILDPIFEDDSVDAGRCPHCETPFVVEENAAGIPRVFCPACETKSKAA